MSVSHFFLFGGDRYEVAVEESVFERESRVRYSTARALHDDIERSRAKKNVTKGRPQFAREARGRTWI